MDVKSYHSEFLKSAPIPEGFWRNRSNKAIQDYLAVGTPTRRMEEWRYSSLQFLKEIDFKPTNLQPQKITLEQMDLIRSKLDSRFFDIVFVNGRMMPGLSATGSDFSVQNLAQFMSQNAQASAVYSLLQSDRIEDSFEALTTAFSEHGVYIEIGPETSVEKPIRLLHFSSGVQQSVFLQNFIEVRTQSKLALLEEFVSLDGSTFENTLTQVYLQASANMTYCRLQNLNFQSYQMSKTRIYLKENSNLHFANVSVGAQYSRLNLEVYTLGMGATAKVDGACLVSGERSSEAYTVIDHVTGHCTTTQNFKSILTDKAKTTFNGLVKIRKNSQKASSDQINKNLLLTKTAEANSKPELQIFADDVKATHGSTVGALNPDEIFYLQSRAIGKQKAIALLSRGFLTEIIFAIDNESLKSFLLENLENQFAMILGEEK